MAKSLLVLAVFLHLALGEDCTRSDTDPACVCRTTKGTLDLSPLSKNGTARFQGFKDGNGLIYSYNPCSTFTDGGCGDAFICLRRTDDEESIIADGGETLFGQDDGSFALNYTSSNTLVGSVEVFLICEPGDSSWMHAIGDTTGRGTYQFELHSCRGCYGGCHGQNVVGIIGLLLIVLVIVAMLTYCSVGAAIKKVRYQATGTDLIPNRAFWVTLPLFVIDGCLFVISPCRRKSEYSTLN